MKLGDIKIGNTKVTLVSANNNQISIISPKIEPGLYKLSIDIGSLGVAK